MRPLPHSDKTFTPPPPLGARASGFTLIELLVVVSLIGVLLSLLVPALGRARAVAKQVVCQTQLRQWALAFNVYASNNNAYYPHIDGLDRQSDDTPDTNADRADYFGWIDMLPPLMDDTPWREHEPYNYPKQDTLFQCPAAKLLPEDHYGYYPTRNGFFSYAMNSCLELDENCWRHPDDTSGPMPSFLKTDLIQTPAQVILLFDQLLDPNRGYDGKSRNPSAGKHCGSYPKAFSARHAKSADRLGGSVLYCDTHVQWQDSVWKSSWSADLEVPPRDDRNFYPYTNPR